MNYTFLIIVDFKRSVYYLFRSDSLMTDIRQFFKQLEETANFDTHSYKRGRKLGCIEFRQCSISRRTGNKKNANLQLS